MNYIKRFNENVDNEYYHEINVLDYYQSDRSVDKIKMSDNAIDTLYKFSLLSPLKLRQIGGVYNLYNDHYIIVISELKDEYFLVQIQLIRDHRNIVVKKLRKHFKCDQLEGLSVCLKDIVKYVEDPSKKRSISYKGPKQNP